MDTHLDTKAVTNKVGMVMAVSPPERTDDT